MKNLKTTIFTALIAIGCFVNVNAKEEPNRKPNGITAPQVGSRFLLYHVQTFSNGCTRTCTGDWSSVASGGYSCAGTAGPLVCPIEYNPIENNPAAKISLKNQVFNPDGTVGTKVKVKKTDDK